MEYAFGAGDFNRAWRSGGYRGIRIVCPGGQGLSSGPAPPPDVDVFEAVRGRAYDHLSHSYPWPPLVDSPSQDFMDSGDRNQDRGDFDRGLRVFDDSAGMGMGRNCLGIRHRVGALKRPGESVGLPDI